MIEKYINTNNINLFVREYQNEKDVIIFLHCSKGNNEQWNAVTLYFKDDYHLVIPDLRGHGNSDKPFTDYSLETFSKDIKEMMEKLNITSAHFVGSSLGGEIALSFASQYPHLVKSLVLEGAIVNNFGENSYYGNVTKEEKEKKKQEIITNREKVKDLLFKSEQELIEYKRLEYEKANLLFNIYREKFVRSNIAKTKDGLYKLKCPTHVGLELTKVYLDIEFEEYFKNIACPVLFLPSEDESKSLLEMKALSSFLSHLMDADVKVISGAVHAQVMFDSPLQFSNTILKFYENLYKTTKNT